MRTGVAQLAPRRVDQREVGELAPDGPPQIVVVHSLSPSR